jgi:ribosomal protein L28
MTALVDVTHMVLRSRFGNAVSPARQETARHMKPQMQMVYKTASS